MIPAIPDILKCPHCGGLSRLSSIVSGNTCGMVQWSDTKRYLPMLPSISAVQKCPACEKYFFMSEILLSALVHRMVIVLGDIYHILLLRMHMNSYNLRATTRLSCE